MQTSRTIIGNKLIEIDFIRPPKRGEKGNPSSLKNFASLPDRIGWDKVYKGYGESGKGYYYIRTIEGGAPC